MPLLSIMLFFGMSVISVLVHGEFWRVLAIYEQKPRHISVHPLISQQ